MYFYYSVKCYNLFFTLTKRIKKEEAAIREYSEIFKTEYDSEEVRYIPNMTQNYKYLNNSLSSGQLVDIFCGKDNKIVFAWKKSKEMSELYKKWCDHELD